MEDGPGAMGGSGSGGDVIGEAGSPDSASDGGEAGSVGDAGSATGGVGQGGASADDGGSPVIGAGQGGHVSSDDVCSLAPAGTFVRFADDPCFSFVCDEAGQQALVVDVSHSPSAAADCSLRACSESGDVVVTNAPLGASCDVDGGAYCDSQGSCVACLSENDCDGGELCSQGACEVVASSCDDQHIDGDETDIDCGGSCGSCDVGQDCFENSDCSSQACNYNHPQRCVANHCLDHFKDSDETDVDCGGSTCPVCGDHGWCAVDSDCASGECHSSFYFCLPTTCTNQVMEVNETGVDCGGGSCYRCDLGTGCQWNADCVSDACDAISLTCIADHCQDHHHDADESDTDCGGASCARCVLGKKCLDTSDCAPGLTCPAGYPQVCY